MHRNNSKIMKEYPIFIKINKANYSQQWSTIVYGKELTKSSN